MASSIETYIKVLWMNDKVDVSEIRSASKIEIRLSLC